MSLPSIPKILEERGFKSNGLTEAQAESVIAEAMKRDLPDAVAFIHALAHEARKAGGSVRWKEDPGSGLGKQLIRLHASDAMRPIASKHFAHGMPLHFVNCCSGAVGWDEGQSFLLFQIQAQDGTIAHANC